MWFLGDSRLSFDCEERPYGPNKKNNTKKKAEGVGAEATVRGRQSEVVSQLIEQVEKKLGKDVKASLGDYIRLVQLQKELEEDEVREIKVTWVDPEGEIPAEQDGRESKS